MRGCFLGSASKNVPLWGHLFLNMREVTYTLITMVDSDGSTKIADELVNDAIEHHEKCPGCGEPVQVKPGARLRPMCSMFLVSRGSPKDPRILRKNYVSGFVVCSEACETRAPKNLIPGMPLPMDLAMRIIEEGRASDERCHVVVFPPMSLELFIDNVIANEMLARMDILTVQMRESHEEEVADVIQRIRACAQTFFENREIAEQCDTLDVSGMIPVGSPKFELLCKCVQIFAVFMEQGRDVARTLFEDAMIEQLSAQFHLRAVATATETASPSSEAGTRVNFPLQFSISRAHKKITMQISSQQARYELRS